MREYRREDSGEIHGKFSSDPEVYGIRVEPSLEHRFQLNHRSRVSEDYFNQFYPLVVLLEATPDFLPANEVFIRLNRRIESVLDYPDFVASRFEELRLGDLQPEITPAALLLPARPVIGALGRVVENLRSIHFESDETLLTPRTEEKIRELRMWVFLVREMISGGEGASEYARNLRVSVEEAHHLFENPPRRAA